MFDDNFFAMFQEQDEKKEPNEATQTVANSYASENTFSSQEKECFVLSVGGSLLVNENLKPDTTYIARFAELIEKISMQKNIVLVAGGGKTARTYIAAAKALGANNYSLDELGITASRLNALLLIQAIKNSFPRVLSDPNDAVKALKLGMVPVYGGMFPGITTDAVAALIAEKLNATFVNLSDVDGIYSSNPKENPQAKFFESISYDKLLTLMSMQKSKPGQNIVVDTIACQILKRSSIKGIFLNGKELSNLENALTNYSFKGTIVSKES